MGRHEDLGQRDSIPLEVMAACCNPRNLRSLCWLRILEDRIEPGCFIHSTGLTLQHWPDNLDIPASCNANGLPANIAEKRARHGQYDGGSLARAAGPPQR